MGIDACIYAKTKDGKEPETRDYFPEGCRLIAASRYAPNGANYEVDTLWRYWSKSCQRGPWPSIAAVLLELMASPNVETVWYMGDCHVSNEPFTLDTLIEFSRDYVNAKEQKHD